VGSSRVRATCRWSPLALVLLGLALPAWGEPGSGGSEPGDLPRVRVELSLRLAAPFRTQVKIGPERSVHGFEPSKDAHQPNTLALGLALELDVKVVSWASLGLSAWGVEQEGPTRHLHYEGISVGGRLLPGGARAATTQRIAYAELSLRYVWTHTPRVHLWFGIGPAWAEYRIDLDGAGLRARGRAEAVFAPALTYSLAARVNDWISIFLTSGIAVSPTRFPSYVSTYRIGLRWHLGAGLELVTALAGHNGHITSAYELWSDDVREGHRWRSARWNTVGLELGLAWSY